MPHSRRDFLKGAVAGTGFAWEGLRTFGNSERGPEASAAVAELVPIETRVPISLAGVQGRRTGQGDLAIHPGESIRVRSLVAENNKDMAWRLRLVGEVDVDRHLRTEGGFIPYYRLIDDALDMRTTHHQSYSLALHSGGELYPRRAYFRTLGGTASEEREYRLKVWVKKEGVEIVPGGRVGIEAAVFLRRPGRNQGDLTGPPDQTYFLEAGGGTQDWEERQLPIRLKGDVAAMLFTVAGETFRGRVWLEDPQFLAPDGSSSLPPFAPVRPYAPYHNWIGENLCQKEWPRFRLTLNGTQFFHGKLFQPEYRWPTSEVDVPAGLLRAGENDLTIQLVSDYHQALAYSLHGLEWLQIPNGGMEVLACPKLVDAGKAFSVLIKTRDAGLGVQVSAEPAGDGQPVNIAAAASALDFPTAGLHFVQIRAGRGGPGGTIKFHFGEEERRATVERVVERPGDGVLVGGGDCFYVAAEQESFRRFHTWYYHHALGNSIVYRHIYHFGGTQVRDPEVWKESVRFSEAAGMKYSVIIGGSEMPGTDGTPTDDMLAGPSFRGSQLHEHDGLYNYWGASWRWPDEEMFQAVYERFPPHGRCGRIGDPSLWGGKVMEPVFYDPHHAKDMREGAEYFIENIHRGLTLANRHSGPSTLFKYFFQAGYKWLAAETLYGPHEIVLGALRGASLAYGQPRYGAHVAAQWSTSPHDDPAAFRRYFLGLATPYIHGTEHIYIEDGLWHMEQAHTADDRFSPACQGHLKVHQDFYHFTQAHSRRGRMRVPVGFVHGQYDGWTCWSRAHMWGQLGSEWDFAEPEKSWDLLKVFFPRSVLAPIYKTPCPHEPVGFFSGTPYGPVDIVPVEANLETLSTYPALVFLGWNTADAEQVERLRKYVEGGGRLILGLPHVSTEVRRNQLPRPLAAPELRQLLGLEIRGLKASSGNWVTHTAADKNPVTSPQDGNAQLGDVILEGATPRIADEAGTPVVVEHKLGKGQLTFVNVAAYPGDATVERLYQEILRETGKRVLDEQRTNVWVKGMEDISFAVYDWDRVPGQPPTCSIYLLNINWWSDDATLPQAHLLWKDADVPLAISRGRIHVVTVTGDWGIWTQDNDTDVGALRIDSRGAEVSLQGQGRTRLHVLCYAAALGGGRMKLRGRSSHGPLMFSQVADTPGLWETEIMLHGPERIRLSAV